MHHTQKKKIVCGLSKWFDGEKSALNFKQHNGVNKKWRRVTLSTFTFDLILPSGFAVLSRKTQKLAEYSVEVEFSFSAPGLRWQCCTSSKVLWQFNKNIHHSISVSIVIQFYTKKKMTRLFTFNWRRIKIQIEMQGKWMSQKKKK